MPKGRQQRLPKQIVVRGKTWAVEVVDWLLAKRDRVGEMNPWAHRILIDASLSIEERWTTLIHEAAHAMFPMGKTGLISERTEERIVDDLETSMRGVCCFRRCKRRCPPDPVKR